jgi:hypothetical protein
MAPLLDASTKISPSDEIKYVRVADTIALADNGSEHHDEIAREYFPDVKNNSDGKPIVDDTGLVSMHKEKIYFAGYPPITCKLKTELNKARAKTKEVAISTLGAERVG